MRDRTQFTLSSESLELGPSSGSKLIQKFVLTTDASCIGKKVCSDIDNSSSPAPKCLDVGAVHCVCAEALPLLISCPLQRPRSHTSFRSVKAVFGPLDSGILDLWIMR